MIVRSPRTKLAGFRVTDGFCVAVGEGVVDCCTSDGVTGFGGGTTGIDVVGESGTFDGVDVAVGLFVAIGVWQPKPFTSKIMTIASANNDFLGLIRVSSSPRSQPGA